MNPTIETSNLVTFLTKSGKFSKVLSFLQNPGPSGNSGVKAIKSYLEHSSMTFFFPLDTAFSKLDIGTQKKLQTDFTFLQSVLQFQAAQTRLTQTDLGKLKIGATIVTKFKAQVIQLQVLTLPNKTSTVTLKPFGTTFGSNVTLAGAYVSASLAVHGVNTFLIPKM